MKHVQFTTFPAMTAQILVVSIMFVLVPSAASAQGLNPPQSTTFIENRGQWDAEADFLVQTPGLDTWITSDGALYDMHQVHTLANPIADISVNGFETGSDRAQRVRQGQVIRMRFINREGTSSGVGLGRKPGRLNYFHGNDPGRWAIGVRQFSSVRVEELYRGIDAIYYVDQGRPRYDLMIAPGADPDRIRMEFDGADRVIVAPDGSLRISTSMGELQQTELFAYQLIGGERQRVACSFLTDEEGGVRFRLGQYDRSLPLVIDPLVWSTYLGGSVEDQGHEVAIDSSGFVYVTGPTSSPEFPTTTGAYQTSLNGESVDVFVTKFDPSKSGDEQLVYSTFFGGGDFEDPAGFAVDGRGAVYVGGTTESDDFPTTSGAYQSKIDSGRGIYVVKLDPSAGGVAQLAYATVFGGGDQYNLYGMTIDGEGGVYIAGATRDLNFPTTPGAFSSARRGEEDAYVMRLDPSKIGEEQLSYSTYLGGAGRDVAFWLAVDSEGTIYVAGEADSASPGFPATGGAFSTLPSGNRDVFVTRLDPGKNGSAQLLYSTLFGGSRFETVRGIRVDGNGVIYVGGYTESPDLPTTLGAFDRELNGTTDLFVALFDPSGEGAGQLRYSTLLGGSDQDRININDMTVDPFGNVYVTGYTFSPDFPTTPGAFDDELDGPNDGFVVKLDPRAPRESQLLYSTFLGGSDEEWISGIVTDGNGGVYITGQTWSSDFPTTEGAYSRESGDSIDAFVAKLVLPSLVQISPNGSEAWCVGSAREIRWNALAVSDVKVELSTDGGTTWSTVISSTPATTGSYSWNVLPSPSSRCRIRISAVEQPGLSVMSREDFSITSLRVTSDPVSRTAEVGDSVAFMAGGEGMPEPTVQWQRSTDEGGEWSDIDGATSDSYGLVVKQSDSGTWYRALFTNSGCESETAVATLMVQNSNGVGDELSEAGSLGAVIFENPVQGGVATLEISTADRGLVGVRVVDLLGKVVLSRDASSRGRGERVRLMLDVANLAPGTYMVVVSGENETVVVPMTLRGSGE